MPWMELKFAKSRLSFVARQQPSPRPFSCCGRSGEVCLRSSYQLGLLDASRSLPDDGRIDPMTVAHLHRLHMKGMNTAQQRVAADMPDWGDFGVRNRFERVLFYRCDASGAWLNAGRLGIQYSISIQTTCRLRQTIQCGLAYFGNEGRGQT